MTIKKNKVEGQNHLINSIYKRGKKSRLKFKKIRCSTSIILNSNDK